MGGWAYRDNMPSFTSGLGVFPLSNIIFLIDTALLLFSNPHAQVNMAALQKMVFLFQKSYAATAAGLSVIVFFSWSWPDYVSVVSQEWVFNTLARSFSVSETYVVELHSHVGTWSHAEKRNNQCDHVSLPLCHIPSVACFPPLTLLHCTMCVHVC